MSNSVFFTRIYFPILLPRNRENPFKILKFSPQLSIWFPLTSSLFLPGGGESEKVLFSLLAFLELDWVMDSSLLLIHQLVKLNWEQWRRRRKEWDAFVGNWNLKCFPTIYFVRFPFGMLISDQYADCIMVLSFHSPAGLLFLLLPPPEGKKGKRKKWRRAGTWERLSFCSS